MNKKTLIPVVVLLVLAAAGWYFFGRGPAQNIIDYKEPTLTAEEKATAEAKLEEYKAHLATLDAQGQSAEAREAYYNALTAVGNQYHLLGRLAEAREFFLQAAEVDPDNYTSWINLFRVENDMGDYRSAYKHVKKATEKPTFRPDPWLWRIDFEREVLKRNYDEMTRLYQEAITKTENLKGQNDIIASYAKYLESQGKLTESLDIWRKLATEFPHLPYAQEVERLENLVN